MKKDLTKKEELLRFLTDHCEIKSTPASAVNKKTYIFNTTDCILFMAEAYVLGMRNAIGQNEQKMLEAKKNNDFSEVIMVYNWSAPEPGMDAIHIPETLVSKLTKEQAEVFLRNLLLIQKDIDEGAARKKLLHELFSNHAIIKTVCALDGERQFFIGGKESSADKRGYAERYAEIVATNVLFDLPKVLNIFLQQHLPAPAKSGNYFVEGRKVFHKKLRYGEEVFTELVINDDAVTQLATALSDSAKTKERIVILFTQALLDPIGLSLKQDFKQIKHYLGKHQIIKLPPKPKK